MHDYHNKKYRGGNKRKAAIMNVNKFLIPS